MDEKIGCSDTLNIRDLVGYGKIHANVQLDKNQVQKSTLNIVLYHEMRTRLIHRLIGRDVSGADNCRAGLFFKVANAALTEFLAFTHSSRCRSRVFTSGSASSGWPWLSETATQNESFSSKLEVVFCSKHRALLYAALNFREPNEHLCQR